jgi:hypothetical protein
VAGSQKGLGTRVGTKEAVAVAVQMVQHKLTKRAF